MGQAKSIDDYGAARRRLASTDASAEAAFKASRNYGGSNYAPPPTAAPKAWQHFGFLVACCDRADLRPTATGIVVYGDRERRVEPLPAPTHPRQEVIDELVAAVAHDRPPLHDGAWARATLEVCLAILRSARERRDVPLHAQVRVRHAERAR
jgi:phthalate 4,5-cis-dihydrodiol dehydrogenase